MHVFYTPDISGNSYILNEEESKHCSKSLRIPCGEIVQLIDGKGGYYLAKIVDNSQKKCVLEVISKENNYKKRNYYLHIAIAPTKNIDRFEWFLEKCTEIGIDEITPLLCDHSERKIVKLERLEKILIAATKQSVNAFLPKLNQVVEFKKFLLETDPKSSFVAHCVENDKKPLSDYVIPRITILIGPEGDFSSKEIELCRDAGIKEISLGNTRLRTETAGIVACHTVSLVMSKF